MGLFRKSHGKCLCWRYGSAWSGIRNITFDKTPFGFDGKKSVPSFDQIGFVWAATNGDSNGKALSTSVSTITRAQISVRFLSAANYLNDEHGEERLPQTKWASAKTAYAKELDEITLAKMQANEVWNSVDAANYNALMG